jgi:integrase/recombinase XerC
LMRGSTGCRGLVDAQKWLRQYRSKISLEGVGIREAPTLAGLLSEWEKVAAVTNAEQQVKSMRAQVISHLRPLLAIPIDQLTTERVQATLLGYLQAKGVGPGRQAHTPGGANALLLRLNTLIGWAVRCGYLSKKPYEVKRFKRQQEPRPVVRAAKAKDFLIALDKIGRSPDRKLGIALMLALGLRESEALGLRWEYLDLDHGCLVVGRIEDGRFQTKGGEARRLPIPTWLLERLRARWAATGEPTDGLVLPGPINPKSKLPDPHSPGYTAPLVRRVGKSIGLPGLSPHRLRASFASALVLEARVPLPQAQKMLGHKHLTTTMRYVEGAEEHQDALAALEVIQGLETCPVPKTESSLKIKAISKRKKAS